MAGLLLALQPADVIVHVTDATHLPASMPARTVMGPTIGRFRFVRVQLEDRRMGDELIVLLGHELFHALEIAMAPDVRNHDGIGQLYRRIGFRAAEPVQFETDEAQLVERRIRTELSRNPC